MNDFDDLDDLLYGNYPSGPDLGCAVLIVLVLAIIFFTYNC